MHVQYIYYMFTKSQILQLTHFDLKLHKSYIFFSCKIIKQKYESTNKLVLIMFNLCCKAAYSYLYTMKQIYGIKWYYVPMFFRSAS